MLLERDISPEQTPHPNVQHGTGEILLDAETVAQAFSDAYSELMSGRVKDRLDISASVRQTDPPLAHRYDSLKARLVTNAMLTGTASFAMESYVPMIAIGSITLIRVVSDALKWTRFDKQVNSESAKLVTTENTLGNALGGLAVTLWSDKESHTIVVEVTPGKTAVDDEEIVHRLKFLEASIKASGKQKLLGGFLLTAKTALVPGVSGESTFLIDEFRKFGKTNIKPSHPKARVFVESLETTDADGMSENETNYLIAIFEKHEPNHPLLPGLRSGKTAKELRLLAKQCLEERLAEVHAPDYKSSNGIKKAKSQIIVYPNRISRHKPGGGVEYVPLDGLTLDPATDSTKSTETLLAAAEYTVFQGQPILELVRDDKLATTKPLEQIKATYTTFAGTNLTRSTNDNSAFTFDETHKVLPSIEARRRIRIRNMLKVLATAVILARVVDIKDAVKSSVNEGELTGTEITTFERATLRTSITRLEPFDDALDPSGFFETSQVLPADANSSIFGELYEQLPTAAASTEPSTIEMPSGPNTPQWYITAPTGTNVAGYWDIARYDRLTLNQATGAYEWVDVDPLNYRYRTFDQLLDKSFDILNARPGIEVADAIKVSASIGLDEQLPKDSEGNLWQPIQIPVLHGHSVLNADAEFHLRLSDSSEVFILAEDIRIFRDDSGTVLYIKLPKDFSPPSADNPYKYIDLEYKISGVKNQRLPVRSAPLMPPTSTSSYLADVRAYLKNAGFDLQETEDLIKKLDYTINPKIGDDTNNNNIYDTEDLYNETREDNEANCITSGTLFAATAPEQVQPVTGYLLTPTAVKVDSAAYNSTHVSTFLASNDKHFYNVDKTGEIYDATPPVNNKGDIGDYFEHPEITDRTRGPFISSTSKGAVAIKVKQKNIQTNDARGQLVYLLGGPVAVYGLYEMSRALRKRIVVRSDASMLDPNNAKYMQARALAMSAGYGDDLVQTRRINSAILAIQSSSNSDSSKSLALLDPKHVKKVIDFDRAKGGATRKQLLMEQREIGAPVKFNREYDARTGRQAAAMIKAARRRHIKK